MNATGASQPEGLRAEYSVHPLPPEFGLSEEFGAVEARAPDGIGEIVSAGFTLYRSPDPDVTGWHGHPEVIDWHLQFEVPRVNPRHLDQTVDLRLVAGLIAHFSIDRSLLVTLVAEEWGWQSHKLSRREAAVPAIAERWSMLGFRPHWSAYSCQPEVVSLLARDYSVPEGLATWGPHFEQAVQRPPIVLPTDWVTGL